MDYTEELKHEFELSQRKCKDIGIRMLVEKHRHNLEVQKILKEGKYVEDIIRWNGSFKVLSDGKFAESEDKLHAEIKSLYVNYLNAMLKYQSSEFVKRYFLNELAEKVIYSTSMKVYEEICLEFGY